MTNYRGFRRAPTGELLFYGWAVFGHILPRIGVEKFPCYADGETVSEVGETSTVGAYQRDALVIEWLGMGTCIAYGKTERR